MNPWFCTAENLVEYYYELRFPMVHARTGPEVVFFKKLLRRRRLSESSPQPTVLTSRALEPVLKKQRQFGLIWQLHTVFYLYRMGMLTMLFLRFSRPSSPSATQPQLLAAVSLSYLKSTASPVPLASRTPSIYIYP